MRFALVALVLSLSACAVSPPVLAPGASTQTALRRLRVQAPTPDGQWLVHGGTHAAQLERLRDWAEAQGVVVSEARLMLLPRPLQGLTVAAPPFVESVVLLDASMPPDGKLATLAHELAHVWGPTDVKTRGEQEAFAELVSVQVCDRVGLNTWAQVASYLDQYTTAVQQESVVERYGDRADRLVARLAGAMR